MKVEQINQVQSDIQDMLSKIREFSKKSPALAANPVVEPAAPAGTASHFQGILQSAKSVVNQVSELQLMDEKIKDSYVAGDTTVSMAEVLIASQKSKLAFEGLVAVRNKILESYKEIMNMPI